MNQRPEGEHPSVSAIQASVRAIAPFLSPALQAALALIDKSLDVRPAALIEKRFLELIETWRSELSIPLEGQYTPQYLDAQSFTQLLMLCVEAAVTEAIPEKIKMYARILAHSDAPERSENPGHIEEALRTLVDVTERDLRVLKVVIEHCRNVDSAMPRAFPEDQLREKYTISIAQIGEALRDLTPAGIKPYVNRLERLGLLLQDQKMGDDFNTGDYVPSHILAELMQLLGDRT